MQDMEEAARVFDEVAAEFRLTVSVVKTKLLFSGSNLEEGDLAPLYIHGQLVVQEQVQSFKYLGSFVDASGSVALDVQDKIGRASRAFGTLHGSVFCDRKSFFDNKTNGVLLHGTRGIDLWS